MRSNLGQTRPRDTASDKAERILEAALHTFAERGFDGATTRAIAKRAGVPVGLLQYYFGDKQKLWQAAVDRAFGEITHALDDAEPLPRTANDEVAGIRAGIRRHVQFVARHPEFVRLMHDEGKRRGPRMRWLVDRHVKPMFERLERMVCRLQDLGRLPAEVAPMHFAYALIGAIDVIFHQAEECRRLTGIDPFDPEHVEQHARLVERLFLGAVGRSSARPG